MKSQAWKNKGLCITLDTEIFFDKYEDDVGLREAVDELCSICPVRKECLAAGVSRKESGVWGGVYLDQGKISREFNNHKKNKEWFGVWAGMTMDNYAV